MEILTLIASIFFSIILYIVGFYSAVIYPYLRSKNLDMNNIGDIAMVSAAVAFGILLFIISTYNLIDSKHRYDRHKQIFLNT